MASIVAAGSTLPFHEFAYAQLALDNRKLPPGAVKIDSNENPLGPCKEALEAMSTVLPQGGRYMFFLPPSSRKYSLPRKASSRTTYRFTMVRAPRCYRPSFRSPLQPSRS